MSERQYDMQADALRALARAHGFDDVRVTSADPHHEGRAILDQWLHASFHADMQWLENAPERRTTPTAHVADAKSVITFAVNYYRERPADPAPGAGKVALYAAGTDYHRVIDQSLKGFCAALKADCAHAQARFYVDYGPVLERAFAERAGLGFVGRSACLIHPRHGTYVFIATVITNLTLPIDAPGEGTCGQCKRCMDVCPTGALKSPYVVDAGLCISYLTIENRGPIPRRLRPLIGDWLFGCDLCQEVCPYNARATRGTQVRIAQETIAGTQIDLIELLSMRNDDAFAARFARSPVKRAKRHGLLRNAAVVAGNSKRPELIPALESALSDAHPLVRGHAVWALGELGAGPRVVSRLSGETDPFVLDEMAQLKGFANDT